jgi:hypothetical protein
VDGGSDGGPDSGDGGGALDERIEACVARYRSCGACLGECEGGASQTWWYPAGDAGEVTMDNLPEDFYTTTVASNYCSQCDPCGASFMIRDGDEWRGATAAEFCAVIIEHSDGCGNCLATLTEYYV